jgi:UPF0755 protein
MKRLLLLFLLPVALFAIVAVALVVRFQIFADLYAGFKEPVFVEIPRGTSSRQIGQLLTDAGVLRHPLQFVALRILRPSKAPQAGEYRFAEPETAAQVFDRIVRGDIYLEEVRVPEGSNLWEIAAIVEQVGLATGKEFLAVARSGELIRDLSPNSSSLEGYLFPATYRFRRRTKAPEICHAMVDRFRKTWHELGGEASRVHETVTLASLVEEEAKRPEERPLIAAVYANRLARGMKLDCDPTVIYATLLDNRYRGLTIHQSDLASQNPYNTYQHAGLPPGPISNPGESSLRAALKPAATDSIYFVAKPDGSGGHVFSATLADHNKAVAEYRRGTVEAKPGSAVSEPGTAAPHH